jgi:ribose transport system permease protein
VSAAVQAIRRINPALPIVVGLLVALAATGAAFSDRFGTLRNFTNVFEQAAGLGFVSLGQTLVILTGGIDLSIDGIVTVAAMLTSGLIDGDPARVVPVVATVLLIGTLIGALNGALTVLLRVHPLIVTIGMASVLQGAGLLYSLNPPGSVPLEFEGFAYGRVAGVPIAGAIMLGLFLAVGIFLRSTRLGRQIYAVGGDPFAARLIGIPHDKVIIVAYALSGLFVVGGTLLAGGRGGVTGTLLGVFLISLLNNLLNYLDVSTYYQWIIQGLIIIVAVSVYVERRRRA